MYFLNSIDTSMNDISIPSSLVAPRASDALAPAMLSALWEIAAVLDEKRTPATVPNSVWLEIPTQRLRGEGSRDDNHWLRQCLRRLTKIELSGEYRNEPWGAVMVAEWHIVRGGTLARILVPPAAIQALRTPETFARVESSAAHSLSGHAMRLYAVLADKRRLSRPTWTFELDELRALLVPDKRAYKVWSAFHRTVLLPAISAINDYGTVAVKMAPQKLGRSINAVRFDWRWRSVDDVRATDEENSRQARSTSAKFKTPEEESAWREKMGLLR